MPTELRAKKTAAEWSWLAVAPSDPDLIAIMQFCAIGLLITLLVMFRFPRSWGAHRAIQSILMPPMKIP